MALKEMLKVANTIVVQTTETITAAADEIAVIDASPFPPGPNKFTLGVDNNAEVVRYAAINGNTFTGCLRGQDGTSSRSWDGGTDAYHTLTRDNINNIIDNITASDAAITRAEAGIADNDAAIAAAEIAIAANDAAIAAAEMAIADLDETLTPTAPGQFLMSDEAAGAYAARFGRAAAGMIGYEHAALPGAKDVGAALDSIVALLTFPGAGPHNSIYRGKFLGNAATAAQYAAIADGTFDDLYIGDYWIIDGVTYRVAAFDYYLNTGDVVTTAHHAVIVPDASLYSAQMNATNVTTGGYVGSLMRTANLAQAKTIINAAFAGHVLTHRQLLVNAIGADGKASGWAEFDTDVELMNEAMAYGASAWGQSVRNNGFNVAMSKSQLPLFAHRHDLVCIQQPWWLRDVSSIDSFTCAAKTGNAYGYSAAASFNVRPTFSIF